MLFINMSYKPVVVVVSVQPAVAEMAVGSTYLYTYRLQLPVGKRVSEQSSENHLNVISFPFGNQAGKEGRSCCLVLTLKVQ